jgi:hypothetical protein
MKRVHLLNGCSYGKNPTSGRLLKKIQAREKEKRELEISKQRLLNIQVFILLLLILVSILIMGYSGVIESKEITFSSNVPTSVELK